MNLKSECKRVDAVREEAHKRRSWAVILSCNPLQSHVGIGQLENYTTNASCKDPFLGYTAKSSYPFSEHGTK